jgi:hypothetical protein
VMLATLTVQKFGNLYVLIMLLKNLHTRLSLETVKVECELVISNVAVSWSFKQNPFYSRVAPIRSTLPLFYDHTEWLLGWL